MASRATVGKQDSCARAIIFLFGFYSPVGRRSMQRFAVLQPGVPAVGGSPMHISVYLTFSLAREVRSSPWVTMCLQAGDDL